MGPQHLEFILPVVSADRLPGVFRSVAADLVRRKIRRALVVVPKGDASWAAAGADYRSVAAALAQAGCRRGFRLALLAGDPEVYPLLAKVAGAAERSGLKAMAFLARNEAERWLRR